MVEDVAWQLRVYQVGQDLNKLLGYEQRLCECVHKAGKASLWYVANVSSERHTSFLSLRRLLPS